MASECPGCGRDYAQLSAHLNRHYPEHKPDSWPICTDCGERYKHLGNHWTYSDCSHPGLSERQIEIATGFLMGDGCIKREGASPKFETEMITEPYLQYLDRSFPWLGSGVTEKGDIYYWATKSSHSLDQFAEWYSTGEKVFPESTSLSPVVLKNWYVCDGHFNKQGYPSIGVSNEIENKKKLESMFSDVGLSIRWKGEELVVRARDVDKFFDYIGQPLPGFRYKWP